MTDSYNGSRVYFYLSVAGLCVALWKGVSDGISPGRGRFLESAPKHAIVIAPIVYFAFCMVDIQGPADLIPLLPFVAAFGAVAIVAIVKREANLVRRVLPTLDRGRVENLTSGAILALILFFGVRGLLSGEVGLPTLKDQDLEVASIVSQLQPGDKIFVHGRKEILVLSGLTNASNHFFLDRGKDRYLDKAEPDGFDGWLERLEAERPRIAVLARTSTVDRIKIWKNGLIGDTHRGTRPSLTTG